MPSATIDIVCSINFPSTLSKLTTQDQKRVSTTIVQLIDNPRHPSLQAHRIENAPNKWECYVSKDMRIIYELPTGAEPLRLWYVGHHKIVDGVRQLSFADTTRFVPVPKDLLPETETSEMLDDAPAFIFNDAWTQPHDDAEESETQMVMAAPLAHYPSAHLRFLGVPAKLVEQVQQAPSKEAILDIPGLPERVQSYLLDIFTNPQLENVIFDPARLLYRTTLDAIDGFCQGRIKQLMLNLTPPQTRCIASHHEGVVVLRGVAGSGKTTVGLYRAIQQARTGRHVLLLTYNKTLVAALRSLVVELEGTIPANLTIETVDSCLWQTAQAIVGQKLANTAQSTALRGCLKAAIHATPGVGELAHRESGHFFEEEIDNFIMARGYQTLTEYQRAERIGRGAPLGKQQRILVWDVYKAYMAELRKQNLNDYQMIASLVLHKLTPIPLPSVKLFDDIIIDETQDITLVKLRAVAHLLRPATEGNATSSLWLLTDSAQTIYSRSVWWQEADLPTPPHRLFLRRNHRNTAQILTAAAHLLEHNTLRAREANIIKPERATHSGPMPLVCTCGTPAAPVQGSTATGDRDAQSPARVFQEDRIVQIIQDLCDGTDFRYSDFAVLCRTNQDCKRIAADIEGQRIPVMRPEEKWDLLENMVKVLTFHSAKGLEFPVVFIYNAAIGEMPLQYAMQGLAGEEAQRETERERALFYVAMTRAADMLYIMTEAHASMRSPFLAELGDTVRREK